MSKQDTNPGLGATALNAEIFTPETVLANDGVEGLIRQERVPKIIRQADGQTFWLIIPPKGTKRGDGFKHITCATGGAATTVEFSSPTGESRGMADVVHLNKNQADTLVPRINAAVAVLLQR